MAAPICPRHKKPAASGRYGWYCQSQEPDPAFANSKGYCNEKFQGVPKPDAAPKPAEPEASSYQGDTPSTSLVALAQMPGWLAQPLGQFLGNPAFELILPSVPVSAELGYGHRVAVSVVTISADPNDREVFKVGTRDGQPVFAYTKPALEKMAEAAGIQIRTERRDDRRDGDYCEFQAVAGMKGSNGQVIVRTATKEFRMAAVEAEAVRNRMKLRNEDETTARRECQAEMTAFRKHIVARTESGAMLRAIRSLLAIKSGLTAAQVARPKVLARVEFNPDTDDPVVKRFMLEKGFEAQSALYLPPPGARQIDVAVIPPGDDPDDTEPLDLGTAATESDPSRQAILDEIAKAAEVLAWPESMVDQLIGKHGGDLDAAKREIVGYVDRRAS